MIFLELFLTFLKIGAFTFGGGYAMLPLIQADVLAKGWMENEKIINFIAVSESTPGPFAINISTYVGMEMGSQYGICGGVFGAFCATLGVVLPSFVIILIIAKAFEKFKSNKIVDGCMSGLKPTVIGLIASAVVSIGETVFFKDGLSFNVFYGAKLYISLVIFAVMTVLTFKKKHPVLIICLSAAAGIVTGYIFNL